MMVGMRTTAIDLKSVEALERLRVKRNWKLMWKFGNYLLSFVIGNMMIDSLLLMRLKIEMLWLMKIVEMIHLMKMMTVKLSVIEKAVVDYCFQS